jgi:hypothetical protein
MSLDCRPRREGDRLVGTVIHDANACCDVEYDPDSVTNWYHFYIPFGFRSDNRVLFVHVGIEVTHRNELGTHYADTGDAEQATFEGDWYHESPRMDGIGLRGVT